MTSIRRTLVAGAGLPLPLGVHGQSSLAACSLYGLGVLGILGMAGCSTEVRTGGHFVADAAGTASDSSAAGPDLAGGDLAPPPVTPCGDHDPGCNGTGYGPPGTAFPLSGDAMLDPNETDTGLGRDPDGYLGLTQTHASFDFLWIANSEDWARGTVSKINAKTVKESARYATVTCFSNPAGGRANCDGKNGCCVRDDYARYQVRGGGGAPTTWQAVQITANNPSRTAVDFNGDIWVANRAFGGQSSVTKIANDLTECVDRNGTPGLQTSSDVNGDGIIDSDCNKNGLPDDIADVMSKPCVSGMKQEYYGLDDECILFTTNTNIPNQYGRPLALGRGAVEFGPADAWAGTYQDGKFFRIDGTTGQLKADTTVASGIYGAAVDAKGILWAAALGDGRLRYFDTTNPAVVGNTRPATMPISAYGMTLDRDQNIWEGGWGDGHAYRYTPDRTNGFNNLGLGFYTKVLNPGGAAGATGSGRGIAADSRTMGAYFVWMARDGGWIARVDASAIPVPKGMDVTLDGSAMPGLHVFGSNTTGAGVDNQQNIWGISYTGSAATRIKVDNAGTMTAPDLGGSPGTGCPVGGGDYCGLDLASNGATAAHPYTYSDFTGFGLRNFTLPVGQYTWVQKGCDTGDTRWDRIEWDSAVPANTTLTVRARSGQTTPPDNTWGPYTGTFAMTPGQFVGVLTPNNPAKYIQLKFDFSSMDKSATPKLKSFKLYYNCLNVPG